MNAKVLFLRSRALLCGLLSFFVFSGKLNAQVVYTDISDATPNATYPLDLNNDSIVDFMIQYGGSAGTLGAICYPLNNNAYAGNFVSGTYLPWALSASDTICASLATWYGAGNPGTMGLGASIGYWPGATNKYLALKLIVGANTYYGWARLDFLAFSGSFTLKDYAYESTPNVCIQAGRTISGNNENDTKHIFSVYPNPFNSSTTIWTTDSLKNATLTIFNSCGQEVRQIKKISGHIVSLFRGNLPGGLYFIRLTQDSKTLSVNKLIISD